MHFCNRAKNKWHFVRAGHSCEYAVTVGGILIYEALGELADVAYTSITGITSKNLGKTSCTFFPLCMCLSSVIRIRPDPKLFGPKDLAPDPDPLLFHNKL